MRICHRTGCTLEVAGRKKYCGPTHRREQWEIDNGKSRDDYTREKPKPRPSRIRRSPTYVVYRRDDQGLLHPAGTVTARNRAAAVREIAGDKPAQYIAVTLRSTVIVDEAGRKVD